MGYIKFGNTWWGNKFLNALNNIDYSNRLPRGQRYARNGSVLSINIDNNKINAKVQGTRPSPYKIKMDLPAFSSNEINIIENIIKSNTYYLSQFEINILPEELLDDLESKSIKLFPKSWEDMNMYCSCPDWAVPCKHLASVVYLIANEIDKNPFIIFTLHNFDILKVFKSAGKTFEEDEIINIDSFISDNLKSYNYNLAELEKIDLTIIEDLQDSTLKLLTERPLFHLEDDFKGIMGKFYKKIQKEIIKYVKELEINEHGLDKYYNSIEINIDTSDYQFSGILKSKNSELKFDSESFDKVIDYLKTLNFSNLNLYTENIGFLISVFNLCIMLLEKSAFIPDLISLGNKNYIIRWIPSLFNNNVKMIFEILLDSMPQSIFKYKDKSLEKKEDLLFLISFILFYFIKTINPLNDYNNNKILSLFFNQKVFHATKFEEQELAKTIHLWLQRFFIHPKNCFPVIKILEGKTEDTFIFDVLVKEQTDSSMIPIKLKTFLDKNNNDKFALLKDLSLLATYLPVVNSVLKTLDETVIDSKSFVNVWFDSLAVLKTLNIETILPKELKKVLIPAITLSFSQKSNLIDRNIISYLSLPDILSFEWTIVIGDLFLSINEFKKLINQYSGIIKFKDIYTYLDPKEIEKIKKQLEKEPNLNSLDLLKIYLDQKYNDISIQIENNLKSILNNLFKPKDIKIPEKLKANLRHYQDAGFRWLHHNYSIGLGSLIADDMGLGKTIQVITFLLKLKEDGDLDNKKVLAIVPAGLITNWEREIIRFAPVLEVTIFHSQKKEIDKNADITLTTYAMIRNEVEIFKKTKWLCLIIDEAQNIKNPSSGQTKSVKSIQADYKIAMTGTPVENRLMDYWSILDYTVKGLMGTQKGFKEKYSVPIERYKDQKKLNSFRSITAPFILRRLKTDKTIIKDLPDKLVFDQYTSLTKEQIGLYQSLINNIEKLLKDSEGIERKGIILKLILELKQICNHPILYLKKGTPKLNQSGKSQILIELIEKIIDRNEKVLIFSQFKEMGNILELILKENIGITPLFLHGGLNRNKRDDIVDAFQNEKREKVMILSLKAGGTGLNLTAANNVIHYDLWWNPAVENQATDRAFRIGQKKNVIVYRIITGNTFEEKINDMLSNKKKLADLTVNIGEKWITEMSNNELTELLKLKMQ